MAIRHTLRPYQREIGRTVLDSVLNHRGLTITVEIARQGGKNELSSQLELLLLTMAMLRGGNLVKAAPTFAPQVLISMRRLKERLDDAGFVGLWKVEGGYIIRLNRASATFLSAEPNANVVGATADLLLEVDEAQDVDKEKFYKEFRPMGASTNVTTVLYGTPWNGDTLLEEAKEANLEAERRDGVRRHFHYDWEKVAAFNPLYRQYVEVERERLGEDHPLFRTQYRLLPIPGRGGLFSPQQLAQLQGTHPRLHGPLSGRVYVAGIDIAGQAESNGDGVMQASNPRQDATVVTIGELDFSERDGVLKDPVVRVVEHYRWRGVPHHELYPRLMDILRNVWGCRHVVVDSTGLGAGVASFLEKALGRAVVEPFTFTSASKSRLGYDLIAAVNAGRVKMYAGDGSEEYKEFCEEMERAKAHYRPNRTLNFLVDPSEGHDDFLISLALLVEASRYVPRVARGRARQEPATVY